MQAGRELDALVAEHVMGWERWTCSDYKYKRATLFSPSADLPSWTRCDGDVPMAEHGAAMVPHYSTDIEWAWKVVETMRDLGFKFTILDQPAASGWYVEIHRPDDPMLPGAGIDAQGATVPLAICIAALRALGVSPEAK